MRNASRQAISRSLGKGESGCATPGLSPRPGWPKFGRMQIQSAEFVTSAKNVGACPAWDWPEFAFIGRSNVGKSSMINLLSGRQGLAKVSATPGKTRLLNFFLFNGQWGLVDLPGYGFAKASRAEASQFNDLVADYIRSRLNLRQVFVLIDSRHPPQAIDLDFVSWLVATGVPYALVFTKVDKLSSKQAQANARGFLDAIAGFGAAEPQVLFSSAKTRDGRREILGAVRRAMGA